jgi:hypothetical protein
MSSSAPGLIRIYRGAKAHKNGSSRFRVGDFLHFGQHAGQDFQSKVLFIAESVSAPLNCSDLVVQSFHESEWDFVLFVAKGLNAVPVTDKQYMREQLRRAGCPAPRVIGIDTNAWDEELKSLAAAFGEVVRNIIVTVDLHGLKQKHLANHKRPVNRFFESLSTQSYRSEVAESFRKRLLRSRPKLFTFLDHDSVPWNNNNAEHAIKKFAYYREYAEGLIVESGLNEYLVLLSVFVTCKYKGLSFLKLLISRETNIDAFHESGGRRAAPPSIELHPATCNSTRWSRERMSTRAASGEV